MQIMDPLRFQNTMEFYAFSKKLIMQINLFQKFHIFKYITYIFWGESGGGSNFYDTIFYRF